ncbi:hypothetical protein TWF281_004257 [Arthrobotrys megalospora]
MKAIFKSLAEYLKRFNYPGFLEPKPTQPNAIPPRGCHPYQFCTGYWFSYCPDPFNCPFGAVWMHQKHFEQLHFASGIQRPYISEGTLRTSCIEFTFRKEDVPAVTSILPHQPWDSAMDFPYQLPFEAHRRAFYRTCLPNYHAEIDAISQKSPSSTRCSTPNSAPVATISPEVQTTSAENSPTPEPSVSRLSDNISPSPDHLVEAGDPEPIKPLTAADITPSKLRIVEVGDPSGNGQRQKKRVSLRLTDTSPSIKEVVTEDAMMTVAVDEDPEQVAAPKKLTIKLKLKQQTPTDSEGPADGQPEASTDNPASSEHQKTGGSATTAVPAPSEAGSSDDGSSDAGSIRCCWTGCDRTFPNEPDCLRHVSLDHIKYKRDPDWDFTCRVRWCECHRVYDKRDNIISHVTNVGFNIRNAFCRYKEFDCPVALKRKWDLYRHEDTCKFRPDGYETPAEERAERAREKLRRSKKRGRKGGESGATKKQKI